MPLRIHLTNGKHKTVIHFLHENAPNRREKMTYDLTYCGHTFATFSGSFEHSVYFYTALDKLLLEQREKQLCPQCMASEELGLDILGEK
jgi:hypothetical protein